MNTKDPEILGIWRSGMLKQYDTIYERAFFEHSKIKNNSLNLINKKG